MVHPAPHVGLGIINSFKLYLIILFLCTVAFSMHFVFQTGWNCNFCELISTLLHFKPFCGPLLKVEFLIYLFSFWLLLLPWFALICLLFISCAAAHLDLSLFVLNELVFYLYWYFYVLLEGAILQFICEKVNSGIDWYGLKAMWLRHSHI